MKAAFITLSVFLLACSITFGQTKNRIFYNCEDHIFNPQFIPKLDSLLYNDYRHKQNDSCLVILTIMKKVRTNVYDIYIAGVKTRNSDYNNQYFDNADRYMCLSNDEYVPIVFEDYDLDFNPPSAHNYHPIAHWKKDVVIYRVNARTKKIISITKT